MPLPPAPTKRAALLAHEAYDAPARSKAPSSSGSRGTRKPAGDDRPQALSAPAYDRTDDATLGASPIQEITETPKSGRTSAKAKSTGKTEVARKTAAKTGSRRVSALVQAPPAPEAPVPQPVATPIEAASQPAGNAVNASSARGRKRAPHTGPTKLFVLDTNVLMHDPMSLFRFEEHDIFLPMIVLEELDGHKKGTTEVARNTRQASRTLDALAAIKGADLSKGLTLDATGHHEAGGKLLFQTTPLNYTLPTSLPQGKADNQILGVVEALRQAHAPRDVVLVSKDINMRVKARALGLQAEDYENDKTLDDGDLLYSGALALPGDFWDKHGKTVESWQQGGHTYYRITGPVVPQLHINQFVYFEAPGEPSLYARVSEIRGKTAVLKTLKDYSSQKNAVWGVTTRNREQNFAMNLLMDPEVDFVTLTGTAGTGKTLLTLASGLTQVLDDRRYSEIIMTRATVSVGEDIGFLPGTEEEKMGPWMGALDDNLEFLGRNDSGGAGEWGRAATNELIRSKIKIKSMNFMRGRTFLNKYVIIDEAQNLTPKQMKTLITRAGPGTKIICMGNLAQIDTPYLTEGSSGLTFAVDRFKGWPHGGHITLARGERSRLADFASEVL
ncbi:PhoH-like ATPase [Comamonas sp. BIGb0124]|uniref:PhoH family protein n=1 Tax=Comamonas sp. BIGb0124 TaxID=2485130 RepID=UPI000F47A6D7|nr:PhoH family protein [Comamonas sp. BIGb0124]ROR23184.1 PhoH-like ATPase [Comamonas sp. BIGb0124]